MTQTEDPDVLDGEPDDGLRDEAVGSVAEEAAKLIGALSGWARDHGEGLSEGLSQSMSVIAEELHEHVDTGAPECSWCPVCRAVSMVRHASPEVRSHLTSAASSLALAVSGLLATRPPAPGADERVQRIRLDDEQAEAAGDRDDAAAGDVWDSWTEGGES
jgi:hypothetical protein